MSSSDTINALQIVNEQLAEWLTTGKGGVVEGGFQYPRGSPFGEAFVQNITGVRTPATSREGSQWLANNTQGTPILDAVQTAFSATAPTMCIFNNNPVGGKTIDVVRLKVTVVAVGASSTNMLSRWVLDSGNRFTSGGSPLTPTNPNLSVLANATGAIVNFGALLATAATGSARTVGIDQVRVVIPSAGDEYTFEFGNSAPRSIGMIDVAGQFSKTIQLVAVPLAPQQSLLWYEFGASMGTARSFDNISLEYRER